MSGPGHPSILVSLLIAAVIGWRIYARFRRSVGRQRLSNVRPWISVTVFPILILLFAAVSHGHSAALLALGAGAAIGAALGIAGLRLTRFERTAAGLYYTPSAHLGIALSLLLVARIAYRVLQGGLFPPSGSPPPNPATPATLLIFGALAGYYITYAVGLLRWRRDHPAHAPPVPTTGMTD